MVLKLNKPENCEVITVRLDKRTTPIAFKNKVSCLMLSGLSREESEKIASEPMELELYYEIGSGLMAVEPEAVEAGYIYSPYSGELYENYENNEE